jgi:hypothetical protein
MSCKIAFAARGGLRLGLLLTALLFSNDAWSTCNTAPGCQCQDVDLELSCAPTSATYGSPGSAPINDQIKACNAGTTAMVYWQLSPTASCPVSATDPTLLTCGGMNVQAPAGPTTPVPVSSVAKLSGTTPAGFGNFSIIVTDTANSSKSCQSSYLFHAPAAGGWGDPHITTVDGTHYDFQSAGEFTALRGDGLEIQTRQTPVATTYIPAANAYTGLQTCVSLYSAIAARVGKRRVSYEPNINGNPDPSGMQLRVDGVLTTPDPKGIDLGGGNRIVAPSGGGGIEIDYAGGTILQVTSAWWPAQQKWYLNVNVSQTTAHEGIYGALAPRSWLPALPGGASLGPKPEALHQRYLDLYGKFADAWRVTDATTLFDYGPGTSTGSFSLADWPRENPTSCAIPPQPSAQPVDVSVAEAQCKGIFDDNMRADCVFDVSVTGELGFATTYQTTQQRLPGATKTSVKGDRDTTTYGENATFTATVAQMMPATAAVAAGTVQFLLDGSKAGGAVTLDNAGRAQWSTTNLPVGPHKIAAAYIPAAATGWGGPLLASGSPDEGHTVVAASHLPYWLLLLLLLLLIAFLILWRLRAHP